jgi:glycosyltransferase involved in cell wall biosynthesis
MTNVLLMGNHPPPYGGVPHHVERLATHLAAAGWGVHVLSDVSDRRGRFQLGGYTVHAPTQADKLRALARVPPAPALRRLYRARREPWPQMWGDVARVNLVRDLVRRHRIDLISAYHLLKPGLAAAWVSESTGVPLVTTVFGEIYAREDEHRTRLADVRYVLDHSDLVLSCSAHCARSPRVLGLDHPVDVLLYGVDVDAFDAAPGQRERYGLSPDADVVLYFARMTDEMGLGTLLRALPALLADPSVQVLIAGGDGPLRTEAEKAARTFAGRVRVLVDVPAADVPHVYGLADVVVAPSTNARACLGLAIVEAMAAAHPVVACAVGGTAEVIVDGVTGTLVPPLDPQALAEAVSAYVRDPEHRARHGRAGRQRAAEVFDIRKTNQRAQQLFTQLAARPRSGDRHA